MTISDVTRSKIKAYLEVFVENLVERYRDRKIESMETPEGYLNLISTDGDMKPFHIAIVPKEVLRISAFQRGFVTGLGTTFEECAKLIALDHHKDAKRSFELKGYVNLKSLNEIERQVANFEHAAEKGIARPHFDDMVFEVLNASDEKDTSLRSVRADLYILAHDGTEYYFEIKSPKPNKGQCLEVTQRLLRFQALRESASVKVKTYFAMAYNPYGSNRDSYNWSMARNYMPFDDALLIGHEFWDIVGDETTYTELLSIYQEVGHDKAKFIIDSLAFGF